MLKAPHFARFDWLVHGFGMRDSAYPAGITTVKQVHSVWVVEAGAVRQGTEADALVSDEPGTIVGVRTADCVPILIVDARTRAVAAVHAGWRGTAESIVAGAVQKLVSRYGSFEEDLHAAIGPAIGPCCYEVSPEVALRFAAWRSESGRFLDLAGINEAQLRAAGVTHVWNARVCTYCDAAQFCSFRREKESAGRMVSFIGRKNN